MFGKKIHRYLFLLGICGLAFCMMMGAVPTSVPQILLLANWLLEGEFERKFKQIKSNKLFWVLSLIFLIHLFGLLYTSNLEAGGNDLRTKMSLMLLPMILLSSAPLAPIEMQLLLFGFLGGCVADTLWCITYTHVFHKNEVVRNASRFMSHIRLGLYLNIAIAVCVYFIRQSKKRLHQLLLSLLIAYFIFCFYALGLASGMVNFVMLALVFLCWIIYKQKNVLRFSFFILLTAFVGAIFLYVKKVADAQLRVAVTPNNFMQKKSPWGSSYIHFEKDGQKENGNYVLINIELQEIRKEWNKRVPTDTFSYIPEHNLARYEVLVRYLASLGLNKDSAAVKNLSEQDLENIQNNTFNYQYPEWSFLHRRLYEAVNEYDEFKNKRYVNGHSLTMRLYFWKAALHAIGQHPIIGVGTGDVQEAMNEAYKATASPLHQEWYKRPHNQFLTITLALGILGLGVFLFSLIYPALLLRKELPVLYWTFLLVAVVSFLVEDTLETQAGQTFFAYFNSVFLTQAFWKKNNSDQL